MSQTAPALADALGAQLSAQGVKTPAGLSRALSELIAAVDAPERRPQALINANDTLRGAGYTVSEDRPDWRRSAGDSVADQPWDCFWLGRDARGWALWQRCALRGWQQLHPAPQAAATDFPDAGTPGYLFAVTHAPGHSPHAVASGYWRAAAGLLRGRLAGLAIASLLINLGMLVLPLFAMLVYDKVVFNGVFETLWTLAIGALLLLSAELAVRNLRARQVERLAQILDERIDRQLFAALLRPNASAGSQPGLVARFQTHYRDLAGARDFFSSHYLVALADVPFIVLMGLAIALIAWPLLIVVVLWTLIFIAVGAWLKQRLRQAARHNVEAQADKHALLTDALASLDALRTSYAGERLFQRFMAQSRHQSRCSAWWRSESNRQQYLLQIVHAGSYVTLLVFGAYLVFAQHLSVGALIAASMLSGRTLGMVAGTLHTLGRWDELGDALRALAPFLENPTASQPASAQVVERSASALRGDVSAHRLEHAYGDEHALRGIDLRIVAGERVALIGRPGSGKSTLARLLAGAMLPGKGEVRIDDAALSAHPTAARADWLAFKPQEAVLVAGSLEENILLGIAPWASADERIAALRRGLHLSGLDEDLARGSLSLDRRIEEYGANLSGGQRQKVALARALALPAKIVILDEPGNGLDPDAEKCLVDRLSTLKDTTLILVTHSARLLGLTERVIALDAGRVLADGPTRELVRHERAPAPTTATAPHKV